MSKTKYNFDELKQEYFESPIQEVKSFFEHKYNKYNRHIAWNTAGWTKEKAEYQKEQINKAKEQYEKERQEKWIKVLRNVDTARMAWLQHLWEKLIKKDKIDWLQVREIIDVLKHMRLELWETTENVNQTNTENPLENRLKDLWLS